VRRSRAAAVAKLRNDSDSVTMGTQPGWQHDEAPADPPTPPRVSDATRSGSNDVHGVSDDRRSTIVRVPRLGGGSSVVLSRAGNNLSAFGTDTARAAASAPSVRSRRDQAHPTLESNVHDDEPLAEHVHAVGQKQHRAKSTPTRADGVDLCFVTGPWLGQFRGDESRKRIILFFNEYMMNGCALRVAQMPISFRSSPSSGGPTGSSSVQPTPCAVSSRPTVLLDGSMLSYA
jgi:hypothetical protein